MRGLESCFASLFQESEQSLFESCFFLSSLLSVSPCFPWLTSPPSHLYPLFFFIMSTIF